MLEHYILSKENSIFERNRLLLKMQAIERLKYINFGFNNYLHTITMCYSNTRAFLPQTIITLKQII